MSEGRGHSRWRNRGQAWPNQGGAFGGLLNVDGVQRRIRVRIDTDGSLEITLGGIWTEPHRDVRAPDVHVPAMTQSAKEARLRRLAEDDVRGKYGARAFGRKP